MLSNLVIEEKWAFNVLGQCLYVGRSLKWSSMTGELKLLQIKPIFVLMACNLIDAAAYEALGLQKVNISSGLWNI